VVSTTALAVIISDKFSVVRAGFKTDFTSFRITNLWGAKTEVLKQLLVKSRGIGFNGACWAVFVEECLPTNSP